jgi:transposase
VITEHQLLTLLCGCGSETKAQAPDGVTAPVQYGPRIMGTGIYPWHGQFLSRDRACRALSELSGCAPSPGALASAARKVAGLAAPALAAVTRRLIGAEVVHFDETGFRTAGRLAWVHSASSGKFVLVTVHPKRGKDGMKAAGVLPSFGGIAVHDAWKPYDTFDNVAGHALCNSHLLRELIAVTETGTRRHGQSTRTGSARPPPRASPSTPPARGNCSRNGTRSRPGCRPARTTTCGSPATCASPSTTTKPSAPSA